MFPLKKIFWSLILVFLFASAARGDAGGLLAGGRSADQMSSRAFLILKDNSAGDCRLEPLPDLPVPAANVQGTLFGTTLYAAGGLILRDSVPVPAETVYSLDLTQKGEPGWGWREEPGLRLPSPRYDISLAVQNRKDGEKGLFLFGGKNSEGRLADAWEVIPGRDGWKPLNPESRAGSISAEAYAAPAISSGTTHILFFGNPEGGEENLGVRAYNVITNQLFTLSGSETVSEGSAAARWGSDFLFTSGSDENTVLKTISLKENQNRLGWVNITVIAIYFLVMAWMGYYFSHRQKGTDDYFRGGARIPWWAVGVSLYGASLSAISYMAVPAKSYMTSWELIFLSSAYLWGAPIIAWFFIPRLRKYNLTSAYEYLEKRFGLSVRSLGSGIFIAFQMVRMAIMLFLPAIAISVTTNFDIITCIILVGAVSVVYTMFGGIEAVIWTDVLQVFILMGGILLALVMISFRLDDGFLEILRTGWLDGKLRCADLSFAWNRPTLWVILVSSFFIFLVPFSSDQTMVQRYFVGKGNEDAVKGLWTFAWITLPGTCLLFFLGTAFYAFYKSNPTACSAFLENNDSLLPWFMVTQMPPGISGLLLVAILAASMSSLSASMNSIAAAWTVDFHQRIFKFSEKSAMVVARASTFFSGAAAILLAVSMATWDIGSFWDEYNRLLGLVTSSLAGIFFLGLLTRKANTFGAVFGLILSFLFQVYVVKHHLVYILLYSGTGFISAILFGYIASLFFNLCTGKEFESGERSHDTPGV